MHLPPRKRNSGFLDREASVLPDSKATKILRSIGETLINHRLEQTIRTPPKRSEIAIAGRHILNHFLRPRWV